MELKQLRYFIEVAEREHFSEAAANLHVAQSAISRQISNLESELEVELFEREGRNVKLLPIGKVLLEHAKEVMTILDRAKKQINEFTDPERGSIRIGFPTSLAISLLPQLIQSFSQSYPSIQFQLRQGSYNFLVDAIKKRELDIAFLGPVITDNPTIRGDILFWESMYVLVPQDHKFSGRQYLELKELKDEEFILFPKGYMLEKIVSDACLQEGFEPNVSTKGDDLNAIKGMVSAGIGITILPASAITDLKDVYLKKIPVYTDHLKRSVGIITPKNRELGPSEKAFYEFVLDYFNQNK